MGTLQVVDIFQRLYSHRSLDFNTGSLSATPLFVKLFGFLFVLILEGGSKFRLAFFFVTDTAFGWDATSLEKPTHIVL